MNEEEARKANDRKAHEGFVKRMTENGIARSEADMAVSVAIEVVRSIELRLQEDIHARVGYNRRVYDLSVTTALELLPTMATGMAEQMIQRLTGGVDIGAMLAAVFGGGEDAIREMFKEEMVAKASQMGLNPTADKPAILIIGVNPTDTSCQCEGCQAIRLISQHPDILPEDRLIVDDGVQAVRMSHELARQIHRDAQLLAQKAGEA